MAEALALGEWSMYPVQIGPDPIYRLCTSRRILNHSCDPKLRNWRFRAWLLVVRFNQVITMDYNTCMTADPEGGYGMPMWLSTCRTVIENFENLPKAIQGTYLMSGIVAEFIAAIYDVSRQRCKGRTWLSHLAAAPLFRIRADLTAALRAQLYRRPQAPHLLSSLRPAVRALFIEGSGGVAA